MKTNISHGLLTVAAACLAAPSLAQTSQRNSQGLEEVIVTAQRREEQLLDVPISITVLRTEELDRSTDRGVADALNRVPGVINAVSSTTARNGSNAGTVVVRGVAPDAGSGSATTAYYLDSIPFGFVRRFYQPDATAYDLERVEVLRGPQGTLYGLSSLNGVVRVLTKDANLNNVEFKARTSASSTEDGGENYRADAALNLPIVEGKLAARAVVGYQDVQGWIDKPFKKDVNDAQVANYRLKINAQPTENFNIGLFAWASRADVGAPSSTSDGLHSASLIEEPSSTDYDAYGLKLRYDFANVSVTSMSSYIDFTNPAKVDFAPFTVTSQYLNLRFDSEVFAQELTLNSLGDGPWRWSVGGIYRDAEDGLFTTRSNPATGALVLPYIAPTIQGTTSESFAIFGEATREFLDGRWDLTVGLRYFDDRVKDLEHSRLTFIGGTVPPPGAPAGSSLINTSGSFDHTTPRAVLAWHPGEDTTLYLSYGEGFRSGLNQLATVRFAAPEFPAANPDELTNYELGIKGRLGDARVNYEASVFFMDWRDVQQTLAVVVLQPNLIQAAFINAESASGMGAEVSLAAMPIDGLTLSASYSWNDLTFDQDVVNLTSAGVPFVLFGEGDRLNFSPEYTASGSVDYVFGLGETGYQARLSGSISHIAKQISARSNATTLFHADDVSLVRASVGIEAPTHWSASLFADNLTNEEGISRDQFSPRWNTYLRPRTIGLQFEYRY
jgi:iron complex outermembrane recepter protein